MKQHDLSDDTAPVPREATLPESGEPALAGVRNFSTCLILILAFLLASAAARNSDLWLHLATGRALIGGDYAFGTEPFSYASADTYWVNPSWLYEALLYVLYQLLGGTGLVILKALAVVALAGLLLSASRSAPASWMPEFMTALALLALTPWLALKPIVLSFVFLAFTCWFLERKVRDGTPGADRLLSFVPLLVVFALWANLDVWFFLGPAIVAFFLLGDALDRLGKKPARWSSWNGLLLLASSVLVCLVNPHGVWVFQGPLDLLESRTATALSEDPILHGQFFGPFREIYFSVNGIGYPAGVAFWILTVLGLGSFFTGTDWPWRWPLLWGSFFCLALARGVAIPFFVIAAAPIAARNLGYAADRYRRERESSMWVRTGSSLFRVATFVGLVFLVVAAWPGWLQLGPFGPRQWHVELDPGLEQATSQIERWQGKQGETDRSFAFSPEAGNYLAWLRPQLQLFTNSHLHLSPESAADFVTVRAGLAGLQISGDIEHDWQAVLRRHRVNQLVIYAQNVKQIVPAVKSRFPNENVLLFLKGKAAIFAWRDPASAGRSDPFAGREMDMDQAAFGTRTKEENELSEPVSAGAWWTTFWRPQPGPSADRDEAQLWLGYFDAWRLSFRRSNAILTQRFLVADMVARSSNPLAGTPSLLAELGSHSSFDDALTFNLDDGPPSALFLALQAAHRAVAMQPGDAESQFVLGKVLFAVGRSTRERSWVASFPLLGKIRTAQMLAALNQAVRLDPQHWQAHSLLGSIYGSMGYLDLALRHYRHSFAIQERAMLPGQARQENRRRLDHLKMTLDALAKEVQKRRDFFDLNFGQLMALEQAKAAGEIGLVGKALDILLAEHVNIFGATGLEMEIKLLVNTGKVDQARRWLLAEHENLLGSTKYFQVKALLEAASGDLEQASADFAESTKYRLLEDPLPAESLLPLFLGQTMLFESASSYTKLFTPATKIGFPHVEMLPVRAGYALELMNRQAGATVVLGLLATESGQTDKTPILFRKVANFWESSAGSDFSDRETMTAHRIASYFVEQFRKAKIQ